MRRRKPENDGSKITGRQPGTVGRSLWLRRIRSTDWFGLLNSLINLSKRQPLKICRRELDTELALQTQMKRLNLHLIDRPMSVKLPIDVDRLVVWAKTEGIAVSKQEGSTIKPEKSPDTFGLCQSESLNPTAGCIGPVPVLLREFAAQEVPYALHKLVDAAHAAERSAERPES